MKILPINKPFCFKGQPYNYAKLDNFVSRSAQPKQEDFFWLKEQGVTDVINFRTMVVSGFDFDEEQEVLKAGMRYHNIPSVTKEPTEANVRKFLELVEKITKNNGKAHIHCKAGADRTGMYSFIYKAVKGIGELAQNEREWLLRGHNITRYPDLRNWAKEMIKKL